MRKSNVRTHHYRAGASRGAPAVDTFRDQMTDYARGDVLRGLRKRKHLSQENAGHEIGVTGKTVREWEKNGPIKWTNALRAAEFYEVEAESIVSREILDDPAALSDRLDEIEATLAAILEIVSPPESLPEVLDPEAQPEQQRDADTEEGDDAQTAGDQ